MGLRDTATRLTQICEYTELLPSKTGAVNPNEAEMCSVLMRMIPHKWESLYQVSNSESFPTNLEKLVDCLEAIEKHELNTQDTKTASAPSKTTTTKKRTPSMSEPIPRTGKKA